MIIFHKLAIGLATARCGASTTRSKSFKACGLSLCLGRRAIPLLTAFLLVSCDNLPQVSISFEDKKSEEKAQLESNTSKSSSRSQSKEPEEIAQEDQGDRSDEPETISQSASELTPQQLNRRAKYITVRIDGASSGSGVIINESNNTYTVLTNWHVVKEPGEYIIQTTDGRQHQVNYQQVQDLSGVDLALVKFTSEQNYQTAEVGDSDFLSEGQTVHLAGYPGVKTNNDRVYRFYNLSVVSLLDTPTNQGYSVLYEGETVAGMSGSPLINDNGQLVGIHGIYRVDDPKIRKGSSYAIPINTYKELAIENQEATETVASKPDSNPIKEDIKPKSTDNSPQEVAIEKSPPTPTENTPDSDIITQSSETGIDYTRLENLLAEGDWQEAHQETIDLMIQAGGAEEVGYLSDESVTNFPCSDLNTTDQLWSKYSDGKFGFNAQRQIWENMGGNPSSGNDTFSKLAVQVGWKQENVDKNEFLEYSELTFDPTKAPNGHLPASRFIPGILHSEYLGTVANGNLREFMYRVRTCSKQ